jgi:Tol biopolymer transport system component
VQSDQQPPRGDVVGITTADGVYEIGLDSGERFHIAGPTGSYTEPSWSADGRYLAFDVGVGSDVPRPTIGITEIARHCWIEWPRGADARRRASVSNDGSRLAYVRGLNGSGMTNDELAELADADGGNRRPLSNRLASATWAPDTSGRFAYSDLEGLKVVDTRGRTTLLHGVHDSEFASWSPDATRLAYSVSTEAGVYVAQADGSGHRKLVEGTGVLFFMSWSPGGDQIAYQLGGGVWVVNADGSNPHELPSPASVIDTPRWTSDGRSIVYTVGSYANEASSQVVAVGTEGGTPRLIANRAHLVSLFHRS